MTLFCLQEAFGKHRLLSLWALILKDLITLPLICVVSASKHPFQTGKRFFHQEVKTFILPINFSKEDTNSGKNMINGCQGLLGDSWYFIIESTLSEKNKVLNNIKLRWLFGQEKRHRKYTLPTCWLGLILQNFSLKTEWLKNNLPSNWSCSCSVSSIFIWK